MDYNNDFSHDLLVGQIAEEYLGDLLENKKIEVKHDKIAHKTNRVFVEFECRDKLSGISITEADFWAFVLSTGVIIFVDKPRLVALCNNQWPNGRIVNGGDMNAARGFLIEIDDLLRGVIG